MPTSYYFAMCFGHICHLQTRIARINSVAIRYDGTKMLGTWKAKRKQFMRLGRLLPDNFENPVGWKVGGFGDHPGQNWREAVRGRIQGRSWTHATAKIGIKKAVEYTSHQLEFGLPISGVLYTCTILYTSKKSLTLFDSEGREKRWLWSASLLQRRYVCWRTALCTVCVWHDCTYILFARDCLYIVNFRNCCKRVLAGWKDGVMHDRGVYHFANGDYLEGVWQEAALITW